MRSVGATPLVFEGAPPQTIPEGAEPISLDELRQSPPTLRSGLSVEPCGPQASIDPNEIQSALLYGELERADTLASDAVAWAPCASLPSPELSDLIRIWGIVAAHQDGPAAERFTIGRTLFPDMVWDDRFAPRYREAFDAFETDLTLTSLTIYPPGPVRVDGRDLEATLAVGRHAISHGATGAWVTLLDAPDTLVLPAAYPDNALSWMADESQRPALTALLAVTLGEGERAMVHHDGTLWTGTTGRVDWEVVPSATPITSVTPPLTVEPTRTKKRGLGPALALSGGALTVVGIALAAGGYGTAAANAEPSDSVAGDTRETRYSTGRTLYHTGLGLSVAGGVMTGTGVAFTLGAR